jgi:hypothetical protein
MSQSIIAMAREAGLRSAVLLHIYGKEDALCYSEIEELRQIEAFAALVRADERYQAQERVVDLFADMEDPYLPDIIAAIKGNK